MKSFFLLALATLSLGVAWDTPENPSFPEELATLPTCSVDCIKSHISDNMPDCSVSDTRCICVAIVFQELDQCLVQECKDEYEDGKKGLEGRCHDVGVNVMDEHKDDEDDDGNGDNENGEDTTDENKDTEPSDKKDDENTGARMGGSGLMGVVLAAGVVALGWL